MCFGDSRHETRELVNIGFVISRRLDPPRCGLCFGALNTQSLARLLADSDFPQSALLQGSKYRLTWLHPIHDCHLLSRSSIAAIVITVFRSARISLGSQASLRLQPCKQHHTLLFLISGGKNPHPGKITSRPKRRAQQARVPQLAAPLEQRLRVNAGYSSGVAVPSAPGHHLSSVNKTHSCLILLHIVMCVLNGSSLFRYCEMW